MTTSEAKLNGADSAKKDAGGDKKGKDAKKDAPELTEEEIALQKRLDELVRVGMGESVASVAEGAIADAAGAEKVTSDQRREALEALRGEVRMASAVVTAIPKALKFLGRHYPKLKGCYMQDKSGPRDDAAPLAPEHLRTFADVLSVVAMAYSDGGEDAFESLRFRLEGSADGAGKAIAVGEKVDFEPWGQEYVKSLVGELGNAWNAHGEEGKDETLLIPREDLENLVDSILPFQLAHSSEPDAVDLLLEVDLLGKLASHVDDHNYSRVCLYLLSSCHFLPPPDDSNVLRCAYDLYCNVKRYPDAAIVAIKLNDPDRIRSAFLSCGDLPDAFLLRCQIGYIAAGSNHGADLTAAIEENLEEGSRERETLEEIVSNSRLTEHYLSVARDLDVMDAKTPQDVYKNGGGEFTGGRGGSIDTARQNLANAIVNGLVNAGFCKDKLVTADQGSEGGEEGSSGSSKAKGNLILKNKEHGKISATATLGLISLWDIDGGLPLIDRYLYSKDNNVLSGALLAVGAICTGTQSDCDPALALLAEHLSPEEEGVSKSESVRTSALFGLGLAYAGNPRESVREMLVAAVTDDTLPMDMVGVAALSLGMVHAGTAHPEAVEALLQLFMTRGAELDAGKLSSRLACIGLALMYARKGDECDAILEVAKAFNPKVSPYCQAAVEAMAYAATGNVLKVQQMLARVSELSVEDAAAEAEGADKPKLSKEQEAEADSKRESKDQVIFLSVLSVALTAIAEDVGMAMASRILEHVLQFGDSAARRAVPLAHAILHVSDPDVALLDTLGRLTHDLDVGVAHGAILALGIMGAGTNHARIAAMLRALSSFYYKDSATLFLVAVAQGLVHMGKGLLSLAPHRADRMLISNVGLSCIASLMFICSDFKPSILGPSHYLLYVLVPAMRPRFVVTLEEEKDSKGRGKGKLKPVPVTCHVGQAVDVVGQAGKPKTITGFQTHNTPVLLGVGERVEMANDKYEALTPQVEGFVVTKENPDFVDNV